MARWIADDGYRLLEWETDLSSQTGASQAGILLGSNEDIPAFRWVEKENGRDDRLLLAGRLRRDRAPPRDRRRPAASTAARAAATCSPARPTSRSSPSAAPTPRSGANPGYRAFLANGFNVTRTLVLFVVGDRPRGHGGRCARQAPRRPPARPPRRHLPADARGDVRVRPRPDRLRRAHRHDARPPRRLRDVLQLRRGRPPLRARARRHARGAAQARPAVRRASSAPAATRRAPTRSSCSPTTARPRARRSSSATATGSTSSSSAR